MSKQLSSSAVVEAIDYDPFECTSHGFRWIIFTDGRIGAERHCRWQGNSTGDRYTTIAGYIADPKSYTPEKLLRYVMGIDPRDHGDFRQTRRGVIVR